MPKRNVSKARRSKTRRKVNAARARHMRERGTAVPLRKLASMTEAQAAAYVARSRRVDQP